MKHIYLDFETTYSRADYSLSKMTTQAYITDPRFEVIGCGVKWDEASEPEWYTDGELSNAMDILRGMQEDCVIYAHSAMFDGSILSWMYGVRPAILVDTLSVARVLGLQSTVGGSLAKLSEQMQRVGYAVPSKGTEVIHADGKRRKDFSDAELAAYGEYCKTDVNILHALARALLPMTTVDEMIWQSTVLKMHTEPMLRVNHNTVYSEMQRVQDKREASKHRLAAALGTQDIDMLVSILNSNPKFAEALTLFGAEAPMKISPATGKPTYALGIKDEEFIDMLDHPIPEVRELVMARMGLKSSIEESRCKQFLWLADFPVLPVPYKVSGARTHRLGGGEGDDDSKASVSGKMGVWNAQNLPSGRLQGQSKALREAIEVPDGYMLVGADSSQIEVRVIDYIAGDMKALDEHRTGVCPYSSLAVSLYGEGEAAQIKRDAKKGVEPWASRRQMSKSARLSLQFGSGAEGFRKYCKASGVTITTADAEFYKNGFRRSKPVLANFWKLCDRVLGAMQRGESGHFGGPDGKLFFYDGARTVLGEPIPGIRLPDGCWVSYPKLHTTEGKYGPSFVTVEMLGRKREVLHLYGAKVAQQLTQATAFSAMKWYATQTDRKIVMNSHDEHVLCVPASEADTTAAELEALMKAAPPWAPGLPLDCEVHMGRNYGELK